MLVVGVAEFIGGAGASGKGICAVSSIVGAEDTAGRLPGGGVGIVCRFAASNCEAHAADVAGEAGGTGLNGAEVLDGE